MQAGGENIYWSCSEEGGEESSFMSSSLISNINVNNRLRSRYSISKEEEEYIDPWDLENYAYIQEHLVVDSSVEDSSLIHTNEVFSTRHPHLHSSSSSNSSNSSSSTTTEFTTYYSHNHNYGHIIRPKMANNYGGQRRETGHNYVRKLNSIGNSEPYAAIDDIRVEVELDDEEEGEQQYVPLNHRMNARRERRYTDTIVDKEAIYGERERDRRRANSYRENDTDTYYIYGRNATNLPPPLPPPARIIQRRFSCIDLVDYEMEEAENKLRRTKTKERSKNNNININKNNALIYDDIYNIRRQNNNAKANVGMGQYGHLKIDYSCNWNNLEQQIHL